MSTEWKEVRVAGVLEFKGVVQTPQDLAGAVRVLFKEHSVVFKQGNDSRQLSCGEWIRGAVGKSWCPRMPSSFANTVPVCFHGPLL